MRTGKSKFELWGLGVLLLLFFASCSSVTSPEAESPLQREAEKMDKAVTLGREEIDQLFEKGLKLLQDKEYEKAIEVYNNLLSIRPKGNIAYVSMYNLACAYSLLGKAEEAWDWLEKSVKEGYEGIEHMEKDPDLALLHRNEKRWGSLVKFMMDREVLVPAESLDYEPPKVVLPKPLKHPVIACTPEELARLRAAWSSDGPDHAPLKELVAQAEKHLKEEIDFPPEGGQHSQWYHCADCSLRLEKVDTHHHKCPKCEKVYSGFPYDNYIYRGTHATNGQRMERLAWAFAITGRQEFAKKAAEYLRGYAKRYQEYPYVSAFVKERDVDPMTVPGFPSRACGKIFAQTLTEASWIPHVVIAYDLIYDSDVLSQDDKKFIEEKLLRAMLENTVKNDMGKSNWQTWHNAAFLWVGAVIGDEKWVKRAIEEPRNGFFRQMEISVLPEGFQWENSWSYHYYTLMAMTWITEGARRLGINLYSHPLLKKMYLVPFDYVMSDGTLPRFADATTSSPKNYRALNEAAYAAYGDERILAALPEAPTFRSVLLGRDTSRKKKVVPQAQSKVFTGAGHAILRTEGPGNLNAAITFGPYGGFHGHFDKLSFVFFGYGAELAVDPGRKKAQAYNLPIHGKWYRATLSHNAVLVDGQGQRAATGKLLAFGGDPSYAAVAVECDDMFDKVNQRRFLLLTPNYLLVVDEMVPGNGKEHTYEWLYHNRGTRAACELPSTTTAPPKDGGFEFLQDIATHALDNAADLDVTFLMDKLKVHVKMSGRKGDEVMTATGPVESIYERAPMVLVRRKGKTVWFCAVLEPVPEGAQPAVKKVAITDTNGAKAVTVTRKDGEDRIAFPSGSIGADFEFTSKNRK